MGRPAGAALACHAGFLALQEAIDLPELSLHALKLGRRPNQHVEPEVIADRHLVGEAAEVPLKLDHSVGEPLATSLKGGGHPIVWPPPDPPPAFFLSFGGALPGSLVVLGSLFAFFWY